MAALGWASLVLFLGAWPLGFSARAQPTSAVEPAPPPPPVPSPSAPQADDEGTQHLRRLRRVPLQLGLSQLLFAQALAKRVLEAAGAAGAQDPRFPRKELAEALRGLNIGALLEADTDESEAAAEEALQRLRVLGPLAKRYRVHLIGYPSLSQDPAPSGDAVAEAFAQNLRLARDFPGYVFAQDQASRFAWVEAHYPDLWAAVREGVKSRAVAVVGGQWAAFDSNLAGGEAQARQMLLGQRYFRERLGVTATVGWVPEGLGCSASLPQVLACSGIESVWLRRAGQLQSTFWWQGPDGSRVLAYEGGAGAGPHEPFERLIQLPLNALVTESRYGVPEAIGLVGGAGPDEARAELEAVDELAGLPLWPEVAYSAPERAFASLRAAGQYPLVQAELGPERDIGHADVAVQKGNRDTENALTQAEALCALASASGFRYPRQTLERAWKLLLANQSPQVLNGMAGPTRAADALRMQHEAQRLALTARDDAMRHLAERVDTRGEGTPILVANSLAFTRSDPATVYVDPPPGGGYPRVVDDEGRECPAQVAHLEDLEGAGQTQVVFVARAVPALGYRVYRLTWSSTPAEPGALRLSGVSRRAYGAGSQVENEQPDLPVVRLSNEFCSLVVDRASGNLLSLSDRRDGERELLAEGSSGNQVELLLSRQDARSGLPEPGPAERRLALDRDARLRVVEAGPARLVLEITREVPREAVGLESGRVRQYLILYAGLERIDCPTVVSWYGGSALAQGAFRLRVGFPVSGLDLRATAEVPFGALQRAVDGQEHPMQRWVDLSGAGAGLSLLNDGRYSYSVSREPLQTSTILRFSLLGGGPAPGGLPVQGEFRVTYSLLPHAGGWQKAGTVRQALQLNQPLVALAVEPRPGVLRPHGELLHLDMPNVVVSGVKLAEDGRDLVLRLYEAQGSPALGTLAVPMALEVSRSDLLEAKRTPLALTALTLGLLQAPGSEGEPPRVRDFGQAAAVRLSLKPWEIQTLRVRLARPWWDLLPPIVRFIPPSAPPPLEGLGRAERRPPGPPVQPRDLPAGPKARRREDFQRPRPPQGDGPPTAPKQPAPSPQP